MGVVLPSHPDARHLYLDGAAVDHVAWAADPDQDDFDATAMETAIIEARYRAFRALAELDAA